ncbi:hypothetical protein EJ04DRAFT_450238 [Polyplosphaeria fusca]|uniref:Nephrocystin 3-like N-terminal domain-containing protein n=1 Tax=Polyplosphaeria fusca TaxID=682080 RepID=A0A9P4UX96_9PLEO|nr:hypothetical protein EJ04DRAFT_450238 [Polyplosphaeria fusca]
MQSSTLATAPRGLNGFSTPPESPASVMHSKTGFSSFFTSNKSRPGSGNYGSVYQSTRRGNNSYKIGFVQDSAMSLKKKSMGELGAGVYQDIADMSFVNFLEWIRTERLTTLPHKGSRWDKVLIRALYFAEQLHNFESAIQGFAVDSGAAAALGYGHARLLLELGHENSDALDSAFSVFYKFALSLSSVLHRSELLAATSDIREQLCFMYTDLLSLVVDVAIRFYRTVRGTMASWINIDIFELFGDTIDAFRSRQSRTVELIWSYQIESDDLDSSEVLDVKSLSRWLAPHDRVLATLTRDHTTFTEQQAEFTCLWFLKPLTKFVQSSDNYLLITGQPGSGKTVLAASIVERLQRPIAKKSFDTLFCSISSGIPTQATSLAVVKSLLSQLLNLRVGNMGMYHALSRAYVHCRDAKDAQSYEDHLWHALAETLKHPIEDGNDVVVVIDGLDELDTPQPTQAALIENLASATAHGKRVRLVALSSKLSKPSHGKGNVVEISHDDVHDDIHAVALKALAHNHHFHGKPGHEQEHALDRILHSSQGSFLWTILACELLNKEKSPEAFIKALDSLTTSKASTDDLVLKFVTSLELTSNAKTLLSWLLAAERPLTVEEYRILFSIDIQRCVVSDKGLDVLSTIEPLRPILSVHDHIVRVRHASIQTALRNLAQHGKVQIPLKESETDMMYRALTYARVVLREKREPVVDAPDPNLADRLFQQHHFLEYAVRYWVLHLQQSPLTPKPSGDFKAPNELQKLFPDAVTLPILERLCWDTQLPTPHALDLHVLVAGVRRTILTENKPAVLQTYLACATCFSHISKPTEAQRYYYLSTKISRAIFSDIHPVTLECATRFLYATQSLTTSSRTELMTHREEILILLITAYERQHGSTSEIVIRTRKLLAELYISIKEEHHATEIYRLIQEATVQHYGKNSHEARDAHEHLNVMLGKGRDDHGLETYKETFFADESEDEVVEGFTFDLIAVRLRKAKEYLSRSEFALAEKTYVELWQEISTKCRTVQSVEWHEQHLDICTAYSSFLQSQKRTSESSAVLMTVWQQYDRQQVVLSETIVTRLTSIAKTMKSMGHYTTALSMFKFASSYFKSVRQEESHTSSEIHREIETTSTEIIKQSLESTTTVIQTTSESEESSTESIFLSILTSSKALDASTVALARKLTVQYMEQRNWSAAVTVIKATLQRTWVSFFASSIHDVTLTSFFQHESIEFVEKLAQCYLEQRQLERVEDVYGRFFRAVLIAPNVDKAIFEKAKTWLISFYDKHGYADNAISVFQEILVVYRSRFGPAHEHTIQTLYTLASRCRAHPRNHPYWIEYYQQIVVNLNKDADACHKDAMEAIVIVANMYWEDRRYAEAVTVFGVLWNTFVRKWKESKEYSQFAQVGFCQQLYERYFQCLEETRATWQALYQVTKQYRETCSAVFGAESTLAMEATLALARVTQRSEEHLSEAISLYEAASKSSKSSTTTITEVKQTLSSLYIREIKSKSSSNIKTETIQRAISMREEQYASATSKYGYAHAESLTQLRELSVLYSREKKTDVVVKQLTTTTASIISKETSSELLIQSAASIASVFQSCSQTERCTQLVHELHRQICAKDTRFASKWSFDVTKSGRAALAFIASLEYSIRRDLAMSLSEIMAEITAEYLFFEEFRRVVAGKTSMKNILLAASPLRSFLLVRHRSEMAAFVEEEVVQVFLKRDAADLHVLSKDSPRIFIVDILDYLGKRKNADFNRAIIMASNDNVASLTKAKKFSEAHDVAQLAFLFASNHNGYNGPGSIGQGFKLASLLVGREGEKCQEAGLRKKMLELSNRIVKKILDICKELKINFAQVQLPELSQLAALLGEQEDYATLEWLLTTLWNTRDAQRSWPATVLVNLGRRLISARYLAGHPIKAIRLCEDIAYNMRRAHGSRAPVTVETYELLAQLYTSTALSYQSKPASEKTGPLAIEYLKKALTVHEDILKLMTYEEGEGDDDDEEDTAAALLAEHGISVSGSVNGHFAPELEQQSLNRSAVALRHLHLLKLAYQRLGSWPRQYAEYERLNADMFRVFGEEKGWIGAQGVEKWSAKGFGGGKAESGEGGFERERVWGFVGGEGMEGGDERNGKVNGKVNGHGEANGAAKVGQRVADEEEL